MDKTYELNQGKLIEITPAKVIPESIQERSIQDLEMLKLTRDSLLERVAEMDAILNEAGKLGLLDEAGKAISS